MERLLEKSRLQNNYPQLLSDLRGILEDGKKRAEIAVEREKAVTYWRLGETISRHLLENQDRAEYGKRLFFRLSQDLDLNERLLYRTVQFYDAFPNLSARTNLEWTHYRILMEVKDPDKRKIFQSQAAKFNWSTRELEEAVKADKLPGDNNLEQEDSQTTNFSGKLTPGRGKLYAYKILPADYLISGPDKAVVDLGFYICTEIALSGQPRLKDEEIVEVIKTDNSYQIEKSELVKNDIYIYKALIDHIIDGDTVCVKIDCGLNIWVRQVLRLRGIDTPELSTPRGQKAKLFLEKALDEVPFIIVKTYKADKYDRYLTDLFYLKSTVPQKILERGTYLNQQLLDLGLAKII